MDAVLKFVAAALVLLVMGGPAWAFPTTGVLDNFNRADEDPLANGTWSGAITSGGEQCRIVSNAVQGRATAGHVGTSYWGGTFGPDSEVFIDITTRAATAGDKAGVFLRIVNPGTASVDGYIALIRFDVAGDLIRVLRLDNAVETQIGSDINVSPNFVSGDGFGMSMVGSTITLYKRLSGTWSSLGTITDATYSAAGNIGVDSEAPDFVGDNFGGGTVVVSGGAVPFRMLLGVGQ